MDRDVIALIPARLGSKRIKRKNVCELNGHPLIAYTIATARRAEVFERVIVSTESEEVAAIARQYGAEVPFLRPHKYATDTSPDIEWVRHSLARLAEMGPLTKYFSILRPTNPFRQPQTIRRAWAALMDDPYADTLRAVEKCHEHPYKMWNIQGGYLEPLFENPYQEATPWHSQPYQALPPVYVQNASLEIAPTHAPLEHGQITGERILAFVTEGYEGFDLNYPQDLIVAQYLMANGLARLPQI